MKLKRINGQVVLIKPGIAFRVLVGIGCTALLVLWVTLAMLTIPDSAGFFESVAGLC